MTTQRRVVVWDSRDEGQLPDALFPLSVELAVFLRYRAFEHNLCGKEGWMPLEDVASRFTDYTVADIETVVRESHSKNVPRFESALIGERPHIRASNAQAYKERRERRRGSGRSERSSRNAMRALRSGYLGESRGTKSRSTATAAVATVAKGGPSPFDGVWVNADEPDTPLCEIRGGLLTWLVDVGESRREEPVVVQGGSVSFMGITGRLGPSGELQWNDGDIWRRPAGAVADGVVEEGDGETAGDTTGGADAAAAAPPHTKASGATTAAAAWHAEQQQAHAIAEPCWQKGMAPAREERAVDNWDGSEYGAEYLTIAKGELLHVQHDEEGTSSGWAYGYSVQNGKYGWFPPSFAHPVEPPPVPPPTA